MMKTFQVSIFIHVFFCFLPTSNALDTLRPGKNLHGNETLISAGKVFEMGFFNATKPTYQYLGIWFRDDRNKKPVWVANRGTPLVDFTAVLGIRYDGNLVMSDTTTNQIFVNNGALATSNETTAKILDSGNLVLMERGKIIWQSFNYPTDTLLPGMSLGWFNMGTEFSRKQYLTSWLSPSDPDTGFYFLGLDPIDMTNFNLHHQGAGYQQIGFWDGHEFILFFQSSLHNHHNFSFVSNNKDTYLTFNNNRSDILTWFVLATDGSIDEFRMVDQEISSVKYSVCDSKLQPNSTGCLVLKPSMCKDGDNFSDIRGVIPSSMLVSWPASTGPSDCQLMCRTNCSCVGYVSLINNGTGCELFYGNKVDLLNSIRTGNNTIYVRGDASKSDHQKKRNLLLIILVLLAPLILIIFMCCLWKKFKYSGVDRGQLRIVQVHTSSTSCFRTNNDFSGTNLYEFSRKKDDDLPLLSFACVVAATDNFSSSNKIGEGGFGPVYKGKLQGNDIAAKRLSKYSGQGLVEFKNEVQLISKVQHRNLVKLLGCCIKQEERILIYEYMPNRSVDSFIFDQVKQPLLDWTKRKHIIEGIAQGLLYLHKYSRLRIIHRDLKTSNILLDEYMNPKISDFGMARILFKDESRIKTKKVAGTYGYMSPEYAVHGLFSTKSDVFSYGVIVLEIVSGRKNASFYEPNCSMNLLGYAWESWKEGRCMELTDPTLRSSCPVNEVMLCIQVGLLCVQEKAEDRPNMSDVVLMFTSERECLSLPKQPAYATLPNAADGSFSRKQTPSPNLASISLVEAR